METLATNRRVLKDYSVIETYDAGVLLLGPEVKSLQAHRGNLAGAYVVCIAGELWLKKCVIPLYQEKNESAKFDTGRERKLLLPKRTILSIAKALLARGVTVLPVSIHGTEKRKVFVRIALVRKLKNYDKREKLKSRDDERRIREELKR